MVEVETVRKSLDQKLEAIHANPGGSREFILADAKDADMAFGIGAPGKSPETHTGEVRFRTLAEYREQIVLNTQQSLIDIMLMSVSTNYQLTIQERFFDRSTVTPAIRANDTTDVHLARGARYHESPARPHRSALLDHGMCGHTDCTPEERTLGANLGLYSVTFNNDPDLDLLTLERFHEFREEAEQKGFRYFLEVFDPNLAGVLDPANLPHFINDMIARMLAGVAGPGRPLFLKMVYHGPAALEELVAYDPHLIVGILGGSAGTTFDAFGMLEEARKYGARVALYGRKINNAENQLAFIQFLRLIADGEIRAAEAVRAYHSVLKVLGIKPHRPLDEDSQQQSSVMSYAGTSASVTVPETKIGVSSNGTSRVNASDSSCTCKSEIREQHGKVIRPKNSNNHSIESIPTLPTGSPDFGRMSVEQRLTYHRRRLGLGT